MNEEIEYAEMLEIPVSTVNIVRKQRKRKKTDSVPPIKSEEAIAIKDTVIANINEKMSFDVEELEENPTIPEIADEGGAIDFDHPAERVDTVRIYTNHSMEEEFSPFEKTNEGGRYALNHKQKAIQLALRIEFGVACALCGAIFLTNAFMPNSAINTFFRALNTPAVNTAKPYTEFTLSSVVSELSDAKLTLSPAGILSLTDTCHIYPVADGKIGDITQNEQGLYTVKVCYSDSFTGVFYGLNTIYYAVGDNVKTNVPLGYTAGENEVQVTMYSNGTLLNCFELTDENCLAWISSEVNE